MITERLTEKILVEQTPDHVHVQFDRPYSVLSSAVLGGGLADASHILNLRVESAGVTYQINPIRSGWNEVVIKKEHLRSRNTIKFIANGLVDVGSVEIE